MKIHTVRNPFYCRSGQFSGKGYPGQVLVVGIDLHALETNNPYQFRIGRNPKVYSRDSAEVKAVAQIWTNRRGKKVAIVPVKVFETAAVEDPGPPPFNYGSDMRGPLD